MRLDQFLSKTTELSRSEAKSVLKKGRVEVNGKTEKSPKIHVQDSDTITLDGQALVYEQFVYYMMNKPAGIISASDDKYEMTVVDLLETGREDLFPVGRLDRDTTGLLLITNDGQLAHRLLSPKHHVDKVYEARVARPLTQDDIEAFEAGIELSDFTCQPATLEIVGNTLARVTIHEGKFHQVKRMFLAIGNEVVALKRVAMGPLILDPKLAEGAFRPLSSEEMVSLQDKNMV